MTTTGKKTWKPIQSIKRQLNVQNSSQGNSMIHFTAAAPMQYDLIEASEEKKRGKRWRWSKKVPRLQKLASSASPFHILTSNVFWWNGEGITRVRGNEIFVQYPFGHDGPFAARISELLSIGEPVSVRVHLAEFFRPFGVCLQEVFTERIQRQRSTRASVVSQSLADVSDGASFHFFRAIDVSTVGYSVGIEGESRHPARRGCQQGADQADPTRTFHGDRLVLSRSPVVLRRSTFLQ